MAFLSRLKLNTQAAAVQRDLRNCNKLHRTVMSGFAQLDAEIGVRQALGVLFSVRPEEASLIVQSRAEPDWQLLPVNYLTEPAQVQSICSVADAAPGTTWQFSMLAQPSRNQARYHPDGKPRHAVRVMLTEPAEQQDWLQRQLERNGASLLEVSISRPTRHSIEGRDGRKRRRHFKAMNFEGRLRVTDPELLTAAIEEGFGPGKSYGLGLLLLEAK